MIFSPITSVDYLQRIELLKSKMAEESVDLVLVFGDAWRSGNCRYLTGVKPSRAMNPNPRLGSGLEMVTVPLKGEPILWIIDYEVEWTKRELATASQEEVPWMEVKPWSELGRAMSSLGRAARKVVLDGKQIVPLAVYEWIKQSIGRDIDETQILDMQRRVKTRKEIKIMEVASNLNDKICEELIRGVIRYGVSEKEIERKIEAIGASMGADKVDANFMISREAAWGHATDTTVDDGDLLSLHVILGYEGYGSDNDRVFGFGNISSTDKELAAICVQSFNNGMKAVRPGVKGSKVFQAIKDTHPLAAANPWTGGHGIGLDGEELGHINEWVLEKGNTFCLHAGARRNQTTWVTEDVIVVTGSGARSLTKFPRDYVIQY